MCCGYVGVFKCIKKAAAKHEDFCTDLQTEANANFVRGFFDNGVNVICGEYNEGTDRCDKFKFVEQTGKKLNQTRPFSFFNPMVKLLSNL